MNDKPIWIRVKEGRVVARLGAYNKITIFLETTSHSINTPISYQIWLDQTFPKERRVLFSYETKEEAMNKMDEIAMKVGVIE